jgi:hypothetical protein
MHSTVQYVQYVQYLLYVRTIPLQSLMDRFERGWPGVRLEMARQ